MDLSQLMERGSVDTGFVEKTVTWDNGDESLEFTVFVKKEMSAADYEFIYLNMGNLRGQDDQDSLAARRVHRMIRMEGYEPIPHETAKQMKQSLLLAICKVLNEVEVPPTEGDEDGEKK